MNGFILNDEDNQRVVHYMVCCLFLPQKHEDSEEHEIIAGKEIPDSKKKFDD